MPFKLISCDGGGIRGYLTCRILQELHQDTRCLDKADGFAGTSTGGLIAVALADGRSQGKNMGRLIGDLTAHYRDDAGRIFRENKHHLFDKTFKHLHHTGGPGITAAQYDASGLTEIGHALVGDRTLASLSPNLVLAVTTVCLHRNKSVGWSPFTITNQDMRHDGWLDMADVPLLDVALASAAAPSYFPPHLITACGVDYGYFADGGIFANNPIMNGVNVAMATRHAERLDAVEALSVGTGQHTADISEDMIRNPDDWGMLKWFGVTSNAPRGALIEMMLTTSAENQYWMARLVLHDRLVRLNPLLTKMVGLANHAPESYALMDAALDAHRHSRDWDRALTLLSRW